MGGAQLLASLPPASLAASGVWCGSERSSPSIHTSIAPNTAAAMQRAVTVIRIRSSVPNSGGSSAAIWCSMASAKSPSTCRM